MQLLETVPCEGFDGVCVEDGDVVAHFVSQEFGLFDQVHADKMLDQQLAVLYIGV